jgi:hypothetical protein
VKVYEYKRSQHHCREGMAVEIGPGDLRDTYWGLDGSDRHKLTGAEVAGATFLFDTDDYEDVTSPHNREIPSAWADRAEDDRRVVTEQHGLRVRYFIRKGSEPSHEMKVTNARDALLRAQQKAEYAARAVEWAQRDLDELLATSSDLESR